MKKACERVCLCWWHSGRKPHWKRLASHFYDCTWGWCEGWIQQQRVEIAPVQTVVVARRRKTVCWSPFIAAWGLNCEGRRSTRPGAHLFPWEEYSLCWLQLQDALNVTAVPTIILTLSSSRESHTGHSPTCPRQIDHTWTQITSLHILLNIWKPSQPVKKH